jgi:hypothetical protein
MQSVAIVIATLAAAVAVVVAISALQLDIATRPITESAVGSE